MTDILTEGLAQLGLPADAAPRTVKVKEVKVVKDGYIKVNKKELDELKELEDK